eukprot:tig00000443_g770.t1
MQQEDWSRGITQCCLLTLLNRQDVPERILYASVDLRPPDRPRKERQSAHAGDVREATDIWLDELDVPEKGSYVVGARARSWHLVCLLEPRETRSRTSSGCRVESSGVILTRDATRRR